MQESESEHRFTKLQAISISLIQTDLRFIFTAVKNSERFKSNYWVSLGRNNSDVRIQKYDAEQEVVCPERG